MPFTLSHAVVALPFRRTPLVASAVAIGAMVPDFPLLVPLIPVREAYAATHSWWGILTVDLVLGCLLLLLWRVLIRPAVTGLAPRVLRSRFPSPWDIPEAAGFSKGAGRLASILISLVIGGATHVVWDLFTHPGRAGELLIPALAVNWGPLPGYDWAQYLSSVVGLLILAIWAFARLRAQPVTHRASRMPKWLSAATWSIAALIPVVATTVDYISRGMPGSLSGFVFRVGVPALSAEFLLLVLSALALLAIESRRHARLRTQLAPRNPNA